MNARSNGKNLKPLFQFLCAFTTTAHIYSEAKSLLIVFHPAKIYLCFAPLSETTRPTPASTDQFSCHIHREFSIDFFLLFCSWYENACSRTGRNGMNAVDSRGFILYNFLYTFFHLTYKVLFRITRQKLKGNSTF